MSEPSSSARYERGRAAYPPVVDDERTATIRCLVCAQDVPTHPLYGLDALDKHVDPRSGRQCFGSGYVVKIEFERLWDTATSPGW